MTKKILIDAKHPERTRVVAMDNGTIKDFDYESTNKKQIAGNIYLAIITHIEPSLQAAFVDYGGNKHGFLPLADIHHDYYQIESTNADNPLDPPPAETEPSDTDNVSGMALIDFDDQDSNPAPTVFHTDIENSDSDRDLAPAYDDDSTGTAQDAIETDTDNTPPIPDYSGYKIQELIKTGQHMLIQVVKEERGNKGALVTTYLSLAGRYCVYMPNTTRKNGVSRKVTNADDRQKLKDMARTINITEGTGLIMRTAGVNKSKAEIKRDYEYLSWLWKETLESAHTHKPPALIYEESNLIKRSVRDLYRQDIKEIWVEGDQGYKTAKSFMKTLVPSQAKVVKHYTDKTPLFNQYNIEDYLNTLLKPIVQLPSGGYLVINQTEALVAVDINSGRSTKEASIEDTALKTNLEAADEIAVQIRLRNLAGLIVVDFIDMNEQNNKTAVEKRLKDAITGDQARIQIGTLSNFGLLEMTRQRLHPSINELILESCPHCAGSGYAFPDHKIAFAALNAVEKKLAEGAYDIVITVPIGAANFLFNDKRDYIKHLEQQHSIAIKIKADSAYAQDSFHIDHYTTNQEPAQNAAPAPVEQTTESASKAAIKANKAEATTEDTKTKPKRSKRVRKSGTERSSKKPASSKNKGKDKNAPPSTDLSTDSDSSQDNETPIDDLPPAPIPTAPAPMKTDQAEHPHAAAQQAFDPIDPVGLQHYDITGTPEHMPIETKSVDYPPFVPVVPEHNTALEAQDITDNPPLATQEQNPQKSKEPRQRKMWGRGFLGLRRRP